MSIVKTLKNAPTPNIIVNANSLELENAQLEDFEGEKDEDGHSAFTYNMTDEIFKFITEDVVGFLREDSTVKLNLKSYDELIREKGEQLDEFEELIKNMSHNQAKQIELLQQNDDESVRKIQEEAVRQARLLKKEQERLAIMRQKAIEDSEQERRESREKYKRKLGEMKKKAEEKAAAGLHGKDSQWRQKIERMQKQSAEDIRKMEEAIAALKKKKEQQDKDYKNNLFQQQKEYSLKLIKKTQCRLKLIEVTQKVCAINTFVNVGRKSS